MRFTSLKTPILGMLAMVTLLGTIQKVPDIAPEAALQAAQPQEHRYLYVGVPGSDGDIVDPGAPGILVFDIDNGHKLVRRIPVGPIDGARAGSVSSGERVRGIAADVERQRLYLSTVGRLVAFDLVRERVLWEKQYAVGCCDRLDLSPDGATIYAPAFGVPKWHVINAADGEPVADIDVQGYPRQTVYSRDGTRVFLAAWESPVISVADAKAHKVTREVGPFGNSVCPFTVNGRGTLAFANVDGLVGFEVADLQTGVVLDRVIVEGSDPEAWQRYECPSHGIALTQDERELWIADGVANRLHVFDATTYPPVLARTIQLQAQPRWITFGAGERLAYASTGDVIEAASGKIVAVLEDEHGTAVRSEKMIEVDFSRGTPIRATHQTAIGGRQ